MFNFEDTICAPATVISKGSALCVIRVSGKNALKIFSKIAKPSPPYENRKVILGKLYHIKTKKLIDEAQWVYYKKPRSYTGEDMIEIFTHGGILIPNLLIESLIEAGARIAKPGEFTMRAVMNGKMSLTEAQAINQIVKSGSLKALELSLKRLEGELSHKFNKIFENIINIISQIEVNLNYPEEDLPPFSYKQIIKDLELVRESINHFIKESEKSRVYFDGIKISICGAPNVGKSTLFNRLIEKERAIVSEIPGTTRDFLSESLLSKGIHTIIYDTAGLRIKPRTKIEKEGIKKAENLLKNSDIILWVFDATKEPDEFEIKKVKEIKKKKPILFIINKIDKKMRWEEEKIRNLSDHLIKISALKARGIDKLRKRIEDMVSEQAGSPEVSLTLFESGILKEVKKKIGEAILILKEKQEEIATIYLKEALSHLNTILGKDLNEEILFKIFSEFCVGK